MAACQWLYADLALVGDGYMAAVVMDFHGNGCLINI